MPAYYDKGMDCRFPQNDGMAAQHAIDLSKHSSSLLTLATGNSYPLLIRLEALTEQAVAEGRTLQQVRLRDDTQCVEGACMLGVAGCWCWWWVAVVSAARALHAFGRPRCCTTASPLARLCLSCPVLL